LNKFAEAQADPATALNERESIPSANCTGETNDVKTRMLRAFDPRIAGRRHRDTATPLILVRCISFDGGCGDDPNSTHCQARERNQRG
jgi:hypothetical protein